MDTSEDIIVNKVRLLPIQQRYTFKILFMMYDISSIRAWNLLEKFQWDL